MAAKPKESSIEPEEEEPTIVQPMVGGLQTAAQLAEETAARKRKEDKIKKKALKAMEERRKAAEERGEEEDETVHRDSTGRARDTKREKAEAKREAREKQAKDMEKMEWGKGLVQREDKEKRKREEEAIAAKPVARWVACPSLQLHVDAWDSPPTDTQTTQISTTSYARICAGTIPLLVSFP